MALTLEQAKNLKIGDILHLEGYLDGDVSRSSNPQQWRVNGKVKLWKRSPYRIRIPIKHGLYDYDYLDENNLSDFSLPK